MSSKELPNLAQQELRIHSPELVAARRLLGSLACETAQFNPSIQNYVVLEWMNKLQTIDTRALMLSARILEDVFRHTNPNVILGIGNSGLPLGYAVSNLFPHAEYREVIKIEGDSEETHHQIIPAFSYSRQKDMRFGLPNLEGQNVLVIDDFIAHGGIGEPVCKALIGQGAQLVGFGSNADKVFQGGVERISQCTPCFSIIRIAGIDGVGKQITLAPEMYE